MMIAGKELGDLKPLTLQQWLLEAESYPPQLPARAHQHFENTLYLFIQVGIS